MPAAANDMSCQATLLQFLQSQGSPMPAWHTAAFTHRGRIRAANEDGVALDGQILVGDMAAPISMTIAKDSCGLMIADGMGGHTNGTVASRAVLDHLIADTERLASSATCADAIRAANDHLYELMQSDPTAIGMGATLVGAALTSTQLLVFNVGDSRTYLHSHDHLIQLSRDDAPDIGVDEPARRLSHAITQAIGGATFHVSIEPHVSVEPPLLPGETLLLCSDGLTDMMADETINHVLRQNDGLESVARSLVAQAFRAGGNDNISLVLARCAPSHPPISFN
jgi:serine/threonine protein phosphatase PrpC